MRIATYNVEWFNSLFDDAGQLINDDSWSGRWGVTKAAQTAALGAVFAALDADAIMIIEAPDTGRHRQTESALEGFAQHFGLRARSVLMGFANNTQQEIALLYDDQVMQARHDPKGDAAVPAFDQTIGVDVDIDAITDPIRWSKPPLEAALQIGPRAMRMIGVHAKSKAPHGAKTPAEATRISIQNRRKQLAQCIWLRKRVTQHLEAGEDVIVLGDFNDGPGLDEYEKLFGRSGVEIVLGDGDETPLFDPHARLALSRKLGASPTTARFRRKDAPFLQALLDYIMVSLGLLDHAPRWQIWHPFDHPECYENVALREALLTASDHFPVVLDLDL